VLVSPTNLKCITIDGEGFYVLDIYHELVEKEYIYVEFSSQNAIIYYIKYVQLQGGVEMHVILQIKGLFKF